MCIRDRAQGVQHFGVCRERGVLLFSQYFHLSFLEQNQPVRFCGDVYKRQTMGNGRSHTHHGFFLVVIESQNLLPFRANKKIPRSPWKSVSKGYGGKAVLYLLTILL